ncbi:hypothetical protein EVG20_g6063 [Dentipellis fragilis]|uniref:NADH-ubiquinone oxidoreductase 51kDa subunit iron-sulphur binding domain-containing protein n=1 Tax=Dentipellis fragilis TaxID=205917 RepID=A0A4Y9YNV1_9AGAM|nr:hypothetical protein EVG20_g6063 [Dentipellis fragilis]
MCTSNGNAHAAPGFLRVEKHCGGVPGGWNNLLGIIPGGCSVPVLPIDKCSTGAVIVMDGSFYNHQSYSQNTPCREGKTWTTTNMADCFVEGRGHQHEIDMLLGHLKVEVRTIHALGYAAVWLQGLIRHFHPEVEHRIADYRVREGSIDPTLANSDNLDDNQPEIGIASSVR